MQSSSAITQMSLAFKPSVQIETIKLFKSLDIFIDNLLHQKYLHCYIIYKKI